MKKPLEDILQYAQMIARKWVLWLFAALDLAAVIVQVIYPSFRFPQLGFLFILMVGFFWAGFQVYRDLIAQLPSPPIKPSPYEILPLIFDIELGQEIQRISVRLYVVNHHSSGLDLHSLRIVGFHPSGGPDFDDIPLATETSIPPKQSQQVWCHRTLSDVEVRSIAKTQTRNPVNATFLVVTHASIGRKQLHQQTPQLSINGWSSGIPDPPAQRSLWE